MNKYRTGHSNKNWIDEHTSTSEEIAGQAAIAPLQTNKDLFEAYQTGKAPCSNHFGDILTTSTAST